MNSVEDGYDLLASVVALLIMLTVCMWSVATIKSNTATQVDEKMVSHNVYGVAAEAPELTAKDALLFLVVNDAYLPDPRKIEFRCGNQSYTVNITDDFAEKRTDVLNTVWYDFFRDKINKDVLSITLSSNADRWIVTLG